MLRVREHEKGGNEMGRRENLRRELGGTDPTQVNPTMPTLAGEETEAQ